MLARECSWRACVRTCAVTADTSSSSSCSLDTTCSPAAHQTHGWGMACGMMAALDDGNAGMAWHEDCHHPAGLYELTDSKSWVCETWLPAQGCWQAAGLVPCADARCWTC